MTVSELIAELEQYLAYSQAQVIIENPDSNGRDIVIQRICVRDNGSIVLTKN